MGTLVLKPKKMISTSKQYAKLPFAGQNTQHLASSLSGPSATLKLPLNKTLSDALTGDLRQVLGRY